VPRNLHFNASPRLLMIVFLAARMAFSLSAFTAFASSASPEQATHLKSAEAPSLVSTIPEFEWSDDDAPSLAVASNDRAPASTPANRKKHLAAQQRHSRLPMSVKDGFEIKITYQQKTPPLKETSMFWVVMRDAKFDLLYATSGGSRSSVSLSPEVFQQLMGQVQELKPIERDVHRCKASNIQLSIVKPSKPERQIFSCINDKGAEAHKLTALSQSLAMIVN